MLIVDCTTIINAAEYGRIIFDLATRRRLIGLGEDVVNRAFEAGLDNPGLKTGVYFREGNGLTGPLLNPTGKKAVFLGDANF